MYAIIRAGGKQYRVTEGDTIHLESLSAKAGEKVVLGEVLLVGGGDGDPRMGSPLVAKAQVVGTVLEQGRGPKVRVFKYKKRKHYRKTKGHRQSFTALRIDAIEL